MKDSPLKIRNYVLTGFVMTLALVGAKILVEKTYYGQRVERFTFEFLQRALPSFNPGEDLPVVVVDISDIGKGSDPVIDFTKLEEIVSAIVKEKPRAIGIDGVLNPQAGNPDIGPESVGKLAGQTKRYYRLLDTLLNISAEDRIPVFLGADEQVIDAPAKWLGGEKYQGMAAAILIDKDTTRVPVWFKTSSNPDKLYSLSASLANAYINPCRSRRLYSGRSRPRMIFPG